MKIAYYIIEKKIIRKLYFYKITLCYKINFNKLLYENIYYLGSFKCLFIKMFKYQLTR